MDIVGFCYEPESNQLQSSNCRALFALLLLNFFFYSAFSVHHKGDQISTRGRQIMSTRLKMMASSLSTNGPDRSGGDVETSLSRAPKSGSNPIQNK